METTKPLTCSVPEAGRRLEVGRDSAYRAAACGEIPTIKIGKLLRVPVAALDRLLDQVSADKTSRKR
jgi:excisionase family DNA binding protein